MGETTVDFIAFEREYDVCLMVLVEEGPWLGPVEDHLHRLQARIYGCLEAALDGQLAEQFPQSRGKTVVIQIDCYDVPKSQVDDLVLRLSAGITFLPDYSVENSKFVRNFRFEVNHSI